MDPTNTAAGFESTIWSLVLGARVDRAHLEQLLRSYWSPVYAFIRRQGYTGPDASDLTQEFLTQVVLGRNLIVRADPARGRFRSFLKQALRNFLIDQHRLGKAHKRGTVTHAHDAPEPVFNGGADDDRVFDREWAAAVIEIALNRLEESCVADGMDAHWKAFGVNVVQPSLRHTQPMTLVQLARHIGAADEAQAGNMLQTIKRRFRRILRDVVAETVSDPTQVEGELSELRSRFAS